MTLREQVELYDRKAPQLMARLRRDLKQREKDIIAEGRRRLIEGYALYGDTMFHWDYQTIQEAILEEYADALCYTLAKAARGWPT